MKSLHSPEYKQFLQRLKKARVDAGLTQSEVSHLLRAPQSFVSKSESGERRVDIIELKKFAKICRKPLTYFIPPRK